MGLLHRTQSYDGYNKHERYHNEYVDDGERVRKIKVHEFKFFDGRENSWERDETETDSWSHDDPSMPDWLRRKLGK